MGSGPFIIGVGDTVCGRNGVIISSNSPDCVCEIPSGIFNCLRTGVGGSPATATLTLNAILRTQANSADPNCPCTTFIRRRVYGTQSGSRTYTQSGTIGCGIGTGAGTDFSIPGFTRDDYSGDCPGGSITTLLEEGDVDLTYQCRCLSGDVFENYLRVFVSPGGFPSGVTPSFAAEINLVDGATTIITPSAGGTLNALTVGLSGGTLSIYMSYTRVSVQTPVDCPDYDRVDVNGSVSITINNLVGCDPGTCNDEFLLVGNPTGQDRGRVRFSTPAEVAAVARGGPIRTGGCSGCGSQQGLE